MDRILSVAVERETDIIVARQRTRQIAGLLGFDAQDQTRITTAVSEIVRNALDYGGGGRIEYRLKDGRPQELEITVVDSGPGIADVAAILTGRHQSATGLGVGIVGARRLMDDFELQTRPREGTTVRMVKRLPTRAPHVGRTEIKKVAGELTQLKGIDPVAEVRTQNREMMLQLQELQTRQQQLLQLNEELQDTNRGVVALYAELEDRADHLRRADQLKSRFLSNMSHEFRTPLNSILSLTRLLLSRSDGDLSTEQEKQAHFIRKAAETLTELVDNLLDIARVEAGKTVITPKEFEPADLFSTLRGMLRPLLVGNAVNLTFEEPEGMPRLDTDEGKVSQILRNFISNALKFTERGEVRVWAEYDQDSDRITFKVRDTGVGIAPGDVDIIWQEFGQVENRLQGRVKGTGLGLPLSKKLAELLRGSVAVESAVGQGSVFSLTIPRVHRPTAEEIEDSTWAIEPGRLPVLVLEDNPADAFSIDRALARSRYQSVEARSIATAKRLLENFTPAALIFDVMLGGEDCWQLLIELKQSDRWHDVPIIVVSTTEDERKARSFGADQYLSKPVDPAMLVKSLDSLTGASSVTKILLVDDEEISRYLVRQLLPRGAYELREATNALDGLEQAREERPDVILLDISMPTIDGFEFLERLDKAQGPEAPPVVVVTSLVLNDAQKRHLARLAAGVVSKSDLTSEGLVTAIRGALERPREFAGQ